MKTTLTLILSIFISFFINAQDLNWAIQLASDDSNSSLSGDDIAVNSENEILVAGNYYGTADFDPSSAVQNLNAGGQRSNFILKLDENGSLIWVNQLFTVSANDDLEFTIDTEDNFYVAGKFREETDFDFGSGTTSFNTDQGEYYVAKYNTDAELIWVARLGKENEQMSIRDLDIDTNGDVIVVGSFDNNIKFTDTNDSYSLFSNGENDGFITKINGDSGLFQWQTHFGGSDNEVLNAVVSDADGNIFLTGVFYETTDLNPGNDVFSLEANGVGDAFITKLTGEGNFVWAGAISGPATEVGKDIIMDNNGDLIISGGWAQLADFDMGPDEFLYNGGGSRTFINKIDTAGNFIWVNRYSTFISTSAREMVVDSDNNIYQTGSFGGVFDDITVSTSIGNITLTTTGSSDAILSKINSDGDFVWAKQITGSEQQFGVDVALNNNGEILATGGFKGSADFNPGDGVFNLDAGETYDAFIINVTQNCPDFTAAIKDVNNVLCSEDGLAVANAINGLPPYSYEWNTNPISTDSFANITLTGNYQVTVSDQNDCQHILGVAVGGHDDDSFSQYNLTGNLHATNFRPGMNTNVWLDVFNRNCFSTDGQVKLLPSNALSFNSANPAPDMVLGDTLIWDFSDMNYDTTHFTPHISLNVSTAAMIGDTVSLQMIITPTADDEVPTDNLKTYYFPIVNGYDPNDKNVYPARCEENYVLNDELLTYTIRFQNTGNAEAINIKILDTLDSNLDVQTMRVLGNSHPLITEIHQDKILNFKFDNILLPDSSSNELESQGYVVFEIKPKPNLPLDTKIENTANIYFDLNEAIVTNTISNTITDNLLNCTPLVNVENISFKNLEFHLSPNPAKDWIQLTFPENLNEVNFQIINSQGQEVYFGKENNNGNEFKIQTDFLSEGVYFFKIQSEGNMGIKRFVKIK